MPLPSDTLLLSDVLLPDAIQITPGGVHVREKPPLREHYLLTTPSGRRYRWGEDEPDPANIPSGVRYGSTIPGGFDQYEAVLPRLPGLDYADCERLSTVQCLGPGGEVYGEFRLERAPKSSGDQFAISPSAVGWQAALNDDKSATEIYVDLDLSRWQGMPTARKLDVYDPVWLWQVYDPSNEVGGPSEVPTVLTELRGPWADRGIAEAWYDAGSSAIASVFYDWNKTATIDHTSGFWEWYVKMTEDDDAASVASTSNLKAATGTPAYFTPGSSNRYALLQLLFSTAGGADNTGYPVWWKNLAVYGNHDITLRGDDPAGVLASDVVAHAARTWAPLLNFTEGSNGTIRPTSFVIPHLAFHEPTTAGEIVTQATRFELPDWAVWENRTLWLYERGTVGKRWIARSGPSQLSETGPQVDRLWESIIVQYQDVDGSTRTVGPPGSGADTESVLLKDTDPDNPANKLGIVRRDLLVMGTGTAGSATKVGQQFLEQTKLLDSSGQATFVGYVEDDRGVLWPAQQIRAGDLVSFTDASDRSWRRIAKVGHSHDSLTVEVDIDGPPEGLQELLERLNVVLVRLGIGS